MEKEHGIHKLNVEPTNRQKIFDEIKEKAQRCQDTTQLCALIYPWIRHLANEYKNFPASDRNRNSSFNEIESFKRSISVYLSGIPYIMGTNFKDKSIDEIRDFAIDCAVNMAIDIAAVDVYQLSINISDIMANYVKNI